MIAKENHYSDGLAPRMLEVQRLVASGLTNKQISEQMQIGVKSVENYVHWLFEHYGLNNQREGHARVVLTLMHLFGRKCIPEETSIAVRTARVWEQLNEAEELIQKARSKLEAGFSDV